MIRKIGIFIQYCKNTGFRFRQLTLIKTGLVLVIFTKLDVGALLLHNALYKD